MRIFQLLAALILASTAAGAGLTSADLPADSRWYVHVNIHNMRASPIGMHLFEESIGEVFADIQQELGVELEEDVYAVTVFGGSLPPSNPAVILHGELSAATREAIQVVMEGAGSYSETEYAGSVYFSVDDLDGDNRADSRRHKHGDDTLLVAFGAAQTMITPDVAAIQRFLEAGGHSERGAAADPHAMIVLRAERPIVQGGLDARGAGVDRHFDSSILNNVEQVAAVIADEGGGLRVEVASSSPAVMRSFPASFGPSWGHRSWRINRMS